MSERSTTLTVAGKLRSAPSAAGSPPRPVKRPRVIGELVIIVLLVKVYDLIRSLADGRAPAAKHHGEQVLSAERLLGLDWEHSANRWLAGHPPLELAAVYWY